MASTGRNNEPLFIMLFITTVLVVISLGFIFPKLQKKINLFSDIVIKENLTSADDSTDNVQLIDSIAEDTLANMQSITDTAAQNIIMWKPGELNLDSFFVDLKNLSKGKQKIRVAWFGDSMIEGDLVTQDFRKLMQKQFGGNGVGYVPVTSPVAQFRQTIRQTFSDDWTVYNFIKRPPDGIKLGISGNTFISGEKSWVEFKGTRMYPLFSEVRLICRQCEQNSLMVTADSLNLLLPEHTVGNLQDITMPITKPLKSIKFQFEKSNCEIHGIYLDNGDGIYVDNFSFRGNSGIPLSSIPFSELSEIGKKENYRLVILSYGLNVVAHDVKKYSWYKASFAKTLAYIKAAFPDASVLLMSVGDKSYRDEDGYKTEPDIPIFVNMQKQLAASGGVAFWNLYEAMGGYNSMVKWAEGNPKLANLDYTHPNFAGGRKIAQLVFDDIMKSYERYLKETMGNEVVIDSLKTKHL